MESLSFSAAAKLVHYSTTAVGAAGMDFVAKVSCSGLTSASATQRLEEKPEVGCRGTEAAVSGIPEVDAQRLPCAGAGMPRRGEEVQGRVPAHFVPEPEVR
eukprot:2694264-Rhodomonas_salina.1